MNQRPPQNQNNADAARRHFLQRLGLFGVAVAVAPAVLPALSQATVSTLTSKCATGCDACVRGCHDEHGIHSTGSEHTDAQWIRKVDLKDNLTGETSSLPMLCQHCDSAPCVDVCPTGASFKRSDGVVLVNKHTCIGCRYCMMACPYKARSFIHEPITDQRSIAPRGQPACAEACTEHAEDAIVFGDLNDPDSDIVKAIAKHRAKQVRADLALNTGVRYAHL